MPRPSRATAHHFAENAPTQTRAPSRASGFVPPPIVAIHGRNQTSPCDQPERLEGRLIQSRRSLTRISLAATPSTPRAERLDTAKRLSDARRTQEERTMPGNPREMITTAERRFSVRIRIAVPPSGLGQRHPQITAWLDENRRADGWAMTPSGIRGVLNDALSI